MCAGVMFAKERSRFGGLGGELVAESTNVMEPINGAKHGGTLIASRAAGALCYNNHFVQRTEFGRAAVTKDSSYFYYDPLRGPDWVTPCFMSDRTKACCKATSKTISLA